MSTENLEEFFIKTQQIIEDILSNDSWFQDPKMQSLAKQAWENELSSDFDDLKKEVANSEDGELIKCGLSGNQLEFKMCVFNSLYKKEKTSTLVLNVINSILGSLAVAFIIAEPIKEFKDFLEFSKKL